MVIRVKKDGSIKLTKITERRIEAMNMIRGQKKKDFREARLDVDMRPYRRYYRWHCICNEHALSEHIARDGMAFDWRHPPGGEHPICWCCWPEWLWDEEDIQQAVREISERKKNNHT